MGALLDEVFQPTADDAKRTDVDPDLLGELDQVALRLGSKHFMVSEIFSPSRCCK